MEKQAKIAITTLLNSFPQRAGNLDLLLRTFESALEGFDEKIICDTASRFIAGTVEDQSLTFSPSVAEFTKAARDLAELRRAKALALPAPEELPREPFEARMNRIRCDYAGRKLIADNLTFETFQKMVKDQKLPSNCEFVGILGAIYAA